MVIQLLTMPILGALIALYIAYLVVGSSVCYYAKEKHRPFEGFCVAKTVDIVRHTAHLPNLARYQS